MTAEDLFECTMCGECCKGYGGTVVSPRDIDRIAGVLGVSPAEFTERYCQPSGKNLVLAQGPDGRCVFWDGVCTIHAVKPRMCRRWPFIPVLLEVPENWQAMASMCPGINRDAPPERVAEEVRRTLAAEEDGA